MRKIVPGALAGLVVAAVLAAPAYAATANVTVRVEGAAQTLVPQTRVTTVAGGLGKDGKTCSGTSAFGAMHLATGGDWAGTYYDDFSSWFVKTIKGETHNSPEAGYWALWINDTHSDLGVCGAELQEGDSVLMVPDNAGPVLELSGVPATVSPGQTVNAQVAEYSFVTNPNFSTTTSSQPAAGATVRFGSGSATVGADGRATITFTGRGPVTVQASEPGRVRSATFSTCVTTGSDGACGSTVPGAPGGAASGPDTTAPTATIAGLRKWYAHGRGPRELSGTVSADPSGLKSVRLAITRRKDGRCTAYDGTRERFKAHRCGGWKSFKIGDRADWSYLLPKRLGPGRYTIRVVAIDKAGNDGSTRERIRVR